MAASAEVLSYLNGLGYTLQDGDTWLLEHAQRANETRIKADCNIDSLPAALDDYVVRLTVGEFLACKMGMGQLHSTQLNLEAVISQIKEGDTTVQFSGLRSPEQRLSAVIEALQARDDALLARFRRLVW